MNIICQLTLPLSEYHARFDGRKYMLPKYCPGWRGSKCKKSASIVCIPVFSDLFTSTRPWVCLSGYTSVVFRIHFLLGVSLFVGVHLRRLSNILSVGLRELYMFGDISCMTWRGADYSITPTVDWRLYGKLSIEEVVVGVSSWRVYRSRTVADLAQTRSVLN